MIVSDSVAVSPEVVLRAVEIAGTPCYLYDEGEIARKCDRMLSLPRAFGLGVRYAMKANPSMAILQLLTDRGLDLDVSSLNEARRARLAGVSYDRMMLTSQEVPYGSDRNDLEHMMLEGLKYNVCSLRQLRLVSPFCSRRKIPLSIRVHPGEGSGESSATDTGSDYSSFGVHMTDLDIALELALESDIALDTVHVHVGSGGDPEVWLGTLEKMLSLLEDSFPCAHTLNMGGGFPVARMPGESMVDMEELGSRTRDSLLDFHRRTGRRLRLEVEPGTFLVAGAGYLLTRVSDLKSTGPDGYRFVLVDGGMECNVRPQLYGSRHPFSIVSSQGRLVWNERGEGESHSRTVPQVVAGRCCETGDCHGLGRDGNLVPRVMPEPRVGDYLVVGGTGAYCSSMAPFNYNSFLQAPELLLRPDGAIVLVRKRQSLLQLVGNELPYRSGVPRQELNEAAAMCL
ncbi:diaminopimelate decarboxylase [Candidatus Fermentibacteria bacterium]|nr:diaminopimelate decarboxylase [Candidatus Fermentibacteria bacterium]